jgi:septal ring factor EnvC (AmiA/AmiB activator)
MFNLDNPIIEALTTGALALVLLVIGLQKIVRDWKTTKAESDIISMLHEEIERMEQQNKKLSDELHGLQQKLISLSQDVTRLTIENNDLREKIADMMKELNVFKLEVNHGSSKN